MAFRDRVAALAAATIVLVAPVPVAFGADADKAPSAASNTPEISEAARKAYAESMKQARALLAQKKYDEAIAQLDKLAAERPREPQARFLKAVALSDQKKADEAIAQYRALTSDFPEMPEPHNNLAVLYAQKGELAAAREELSIAIQTAP